MPFRLWHVFPQTPVKNQPIRERIITSVSAAPGSAWPGRRSHGVQIHPPTVQQVAPSIRSTHPPRSVVCFHAASPAKHSDRCWIVLVCF
jgi:hypothetical protein